MNTKVNVWLEPIDMNNRRCYSKVFFNVIINGDFTDKTPKDAEDYISIKEIMDFANIHHNWNYGVVSLSKTKKNPCISFASAKKNTKQQVENSEELNVAPKDIMLHNLNKITKSGKLKLELKKDDVLIQDGGKLHVVKNDLKIHEIDFPLIWAMIKKNIIGKIKDGDFATIKDDDGNVLIELHGGSFLNVGLADLAVYDTKKMAEKRSIFTHGQGMLGGMFVRNDGNLDIGDLKRTFWIEIHTSKLIAACSKTNKSINEFFKIKLIQ